jgi:hypothetical protein
LFLIKRFGVVTEMANKGGYVPPQYVPLYGLDTEEDRVPPIEENPINSAGILHNGLLASVLVLMIHRAVCYFLTCDPLIYRRKRLKVLFGCMTGCKRDTDIFVFLFQIRRFVVIMWCTLK